MSARQKFKNAAARAAGRPLKPAKRRVIDIIDPRDGPTAEFRERHDTISRGSNPGRRVYTKLERLLRTHFIRPEESEAGYRFKTDFAKGIVGRGRSCLDIGSGGGGDGAPSMVRLDAARRFQDAAAALDSSSAPRSTMISSSHILTMFCVDDASYSQLATRAGVGEERVKNWIGAYLKVLAEHYKAIDKKSGREMTSYTVEHALKRFDPKDDV